MIVRAVSSWLADLEARITRGDALASTEAEDLLQLDPGGTYELLAVANRVARRHKGWAVDLCGIVNAKSGSCPEDCSFCAQSAHHKADVPSHALIDAERMVEAARETAGMAAARFGIVTSGTGIRAGQELDTVCVAIERIRREGRISPCASLGIASEEVLVRLRDAGLIGYHHNLETARSFFANVCTTHDYEQDIATVRRAKRVGLRVCSGGIFGLGESAAQRVELAESLRELGVDSVPINFLVGVRGTPMADQPALEPLECLRIVAVFRLMMPAVTLKVCAGRERNLGDMTSWVLFAGANGLMVGNYLTTCGRDHRADLAMIRALGFHPVGVEELES
jgi:biotin synthase